MREEAIVMNWISYLRSVEGTCNTYMYVVM